MKSVFLKNCGSSRLILLFGGWGSGPELFAECPVAEDYDLLLCYDYRDLSFDYGLLEPYSSIRLIAWSMGVWAAGEIFGGHSEAGDLLDEDDSLDDDSYTIETCHLTENLYYNNRIEKSIAFGGTPFPIDSEKGIAPEIFFATLQAISGSSAASSATSSAATSATSPAASLNKFRRRMCGGNLGYYLSHLPCRSIEELAEELGCIAQAVSHGSHRHDSKNSPLKWDVALVGEKDMIFHPANQLNAWREAGVPTSVLPGVPHYDNAVFEKLEKLE